MKPIKQYRYFIEYTEDPNKVIVSIQEKNTFVTWWFFERIEWLNIYKHEINPIIKKKYSFIESFLEDYYKENIKKENTVMHTHIFSNVKES